MKLKIIIFTAITFLILLSYNCLGMLFVEFSEENVCSFATVFVRIGTDLSFISYIKDSDFKYAYDLWETINNRQVVQIIFSDTEIYLGTVLFSYEGFFSLIDK